MERVVMTIKEVLNLFTVSNLFIFLSILFLILLTIYIISFSRDDDIIIDVMDDNIIKKKKKSYNKSKALDDLNMIVNKLQDSYEPKRIDLTKYEEEQESTAIISYDELVNRVSNDISYDESYDSGFDDLSVKKVTDESDTKEYVNLKEAVMMRYESEENFLKALKKLQKNLVR
jgi:transcriptional regulator of heat shock response